MTAKKKDSRKSSIYSGPRGHRQMSPAGSAYPYEVFLTHERFRALQAIDEEWVGSEHYMGLAWFWNYEYRFHLRDVTSEHRVRVHHALLDAGLELDGESRDHLEIIESFVGSVS